MVAHCNKSESLRGPASPEFVDLVRRQRKGLNPQQKTAFLDSFRRIVRYFGTQRWFTAVDVGDAVERMRSRLKDRRVRVRQIWVGYGPRRKPGGAVGASAWARWKLNGVYYRLQTNRRLHPAIAFVTLRAGAQVASNQRSAERARG